MKRISRDLGIEIGPETIGSRDDADKLVDRGKREHDLKGIDYRTAARRYADFVQASKSAQEDDETRLRKPGFPSVGEKHRIVLDLLRRMEMPVTKTQVGTAVADHLGFTAEQRAERRPDGRHRCVDWDVGWVLSDLKNAEFLSQPRSGIWTLTEDGGRLPFEDYWRRKRERDKRVRERRQSNKTDVPANHDMSGADEEEAEADRQEAPEPYGIHSALQDLFVSQNQLTRILDSINRRKNLILQGPPGVGKTFIARRIAWCLIGRKDSNPVEMVQFHQSYAYEDFVQGWRPTETGGFTLRNGVFFEFCERARERPSTPFVFIIDEINRGNLSRIFGELLMLIEADKRGSEYAIPLTYSATGERFAVPDNVHVLGLMNTADRSLAMVDYALRRRFAFETLRPAYRTEEFREYLIEAGVDRSLVDRIEDRISAINERIREDTDLGPGFQIGHSYFVPDDGVDSPDERWFRTIVDTQIEPLLREYWFDRPETVDELLETLRQ